MLIICATEAHQGLGKQKNKMNASIKVGSRIYVKNKEEEFGPGTVRFVGPTKIAPGDWVGLELDRAGVSPPRPPVSPANLCLIAGYNDGTVKGDRYFTCPPKHGLLVKISLAELVSVLLPSLPTVS